MRGNACGLELLLAEGGIAVCRLAGGSAPPDWACGGPLMAWIATASEVTVVCAEDRVPDGIQREAGWRCLSVAGPLDLSLVGILSRLTAVLAEARIPVFALSSFDTDHLLVRAEDLDRAVAALRDAGHRVRE